MFLFFISYIGDIMILFLKAIIIGIGKIIPGVSGAMLAINFNVYERLINALTNFFDDWKNNFKFLIIFISGVLFSLIVFSNLIIFFLNKYFFITMMFFIGLIIGGTYKFSFNIKYNFKNILLVIFVFLIIILLGISNLNNNYFLSYTFMDNIVFFFGGIIEIFASIVPGISATSLLMIIGIYDDVLVMMAEVFNYSYVIHNLNLYFSYGLGMFFSFFFGVNIINYCFKKNKNISYIIILGLSIASIILLCLNVFSKEINSFDMFFGLLLLIIGMIISLFLDK